ncbi:MAG: DUF4340 domain-containing protein [Planctomycetota bacterium]
MNKNTTLILLAILAVLAAGVYFTKGDAKETNRSTEKMIANFAPEKVATLRVENAERNEKIVMTRVVAGGGWEMLEPVKSPADKAQAEFLARYFADYDGKRIGKVGDSNINLEQQGLAKPRAIVELEGVTEKPIHVRIGVDSPLNKIDCFLQIGDIVYLAPRTIYNTIAKPALSFRDTRVFTIATASSDLDQIEITRDGKATLFKREGTEWNFLSPFRGQADAKLVSQIANNLAGLRILSFESDLTKDFSTFGLEQPPLIVTFRAGDKSETVKFGRIDNDQKTFAAREGMQSVWKVAEPDLAIARKPAEELREAAVFGSFQNENVEKLSWKSAAGEIEFIFDTITRKAKLTKPRAADADREAFDAAVRGIQGLRAEKILALSEVNLSDYALAPAAGSIELNLKGASKNTIVELGSIKAEGAHVRRAGDDYILRVPSSSAQFLTRPLAEYVSKDIVSIDSFAPGHVEIDVHYNNEKQTRVFVRNENNKWTMKGATEESADFAGLADTLWHTRATEVTIAEVKDTALANPNIEIRVYRKLMNDPKGDEKERDRLATMRFARVDLGESGGENWIANGVTGATASGGFVMKVDSATPLRIVALVLGAAATQPAK